MYVCQTTTFESLDTGSSFRSFSASPGNTGQVHIQRSSGQGQGHRSKQRRKYLFPQCKTSIGNNSASIKHRALNSACGMGFSAMADRMVWSPYLSCDRKWPRVTKCTHSRMVGLKLEGNLIYLIFRRLLVIGLAKIVPKTIVCTSLTSGDWRLLTVFLDIWLDHVRSLFSPFVHQFLVFSACGIYYFSTFSF